ncbi:MAG: DciA family protein, partial [Pseudomonadota bacterium]
MSERSTEADAAWAEALARVRLQRMRGKRARPPAPPVASAARRVLRPFAKKGGAPVTVLKARWKEIAGDKLSKVCRPEKISGGKNGRTLTLVVLAAAAPAVQHQSETIRQRASVALGGDISKVKLVHGALSDRTDLKKPPPRTLTPEERRGLEAR